MNTTTYPATVRELGDMAEARGMTASELLEELGDIPRPPVGYVSVEGVDGLYVGQQIEAASLIIVPAFDYRAQSHSVELWTGKGTAGESIVSLSPADALQLSAALAEVARTTA